MSGNVDMGEKRQTRHPLRVIMGRLIYLAWKIYFAFSVPVVRIILKFPICEIIFTNLKYPVQQFFKLKLTRSFFKSKVIPDKYFQETVVSKCQRFLVL
jgi:hypothetical protein